VILGKTKRKTGVKAEMGIQSGNAGNEAKLVPRSKQKVAICLYRRVSERTNTEGDECEGEKESVFSRTGGPGGGASL